jgi:hypothetical protein
MGSAWWVSERKRSAVEIMTESLIRAYPYLSLPQANPFPDHLSGAEWREVRRRVRARYRTQAQGMLEDAYKYARFMEGKDLESAKRNAASKHRLMYDSAADCLRDYIDAARDAALVFHRLALNLKQLKDQRTAGKNVRPMNEGSERT